MMPGIVAADNDFDEPLQPLLTSLFFDSASAVIPSRYHLFSSPSETTGFSDTANSAGTLASYYDLLNIIGYRMRKYPKTKIELLGGHWWMQNLGEERTLAIERPRAVSHYLTTIWGIGPARIAITPLSPAICVLGISDRPLRAAEGRQVTIVSNHWEITGPIFNRTSRPRLHSDSLRLRIRLIQYKFDSPEPGPMNMRSLKEYVYPLITPNSAIHVIGRNDIMGLEDRMLKLSTLRAEATADAIGKGKRKRFASLDHRGVGKADPLYSNELPEGRGYNRTVEIEIVSPLVSGW